jgi:rhodanese-related sulfurtransferase
LLRAEVTTLLELVGRHEATAITAIALGLFAWLAWKLWQKYRFEQLAAIPHITAAELLAALGSDNPPLLLDFRGEALVARTGPIAGATRARLDDLPRAASDWPKQRHIVTMCACPGDATAIQAARRLTALGYTSVRPLKGGYESWTRQSAQP